MGQTTSSDKKDAIDMFAKFPKDLPSLNNLFYNVRKQLEFPFKDGHDDGAVGDWYDRLPKILQKHSYTLDHIINTIVEQKAIYNYHNNPVEVVYTPEQVDTMYTVFKQEMEKMLAETKRMLAPIESSGPGIELGPMGSMKPVRSATGGNRSHIRRRGTKRARRGRRRSSRKN